MARFDKLTGERLDPEQTPGEWGEPASEPKPPAPEALTQTDGGAKQPADTRSGHKPPKHHKGHR